MRPILLVIVLVAFLALYLIILSPASGLVKFLLGALDMFIVGQFLINQYKFTGEYGLILLRSKRGISLIQKIARREDLWKFLSDTGIVLSYGLLSVLLMRRHVSWKSLLLGLALLAGLFFLVMPSALLFLTSILGVNLLSHSTSLQLSAFSGVLSYLLVVMLLGGFFSILLMGLLSYGALVILPNLFSTLLQGTNALGQTTPGGTLLLPGINLPFVEGVLALAVILVVHEGAHAILARIARIPILSSGIVLFGVIPVGAFVEPDEEKLKKLEQTAQTRVLVAGSTANLLTSILFFVLFTAFGWVIETSGLSSLSTILPIVHFVSVLLGLTFALNFVVGTVNLLPLPFFDGYRTLELNFRYKPVLHLITALTLIAFLLNFLPWLFVR